MDELLAGFELYQKQRTSPGAPPQITVQSRGIFSLNPSAHAALGEPSFVELLYAKDRNAVAIRAVGSETQTSYQVRKANNGGVFNVAGRAFMVYHGIDLPESRRYTPHHAKDGVVIIGLDSDPYIPLQATRRASADKEARKPSPPGANEAADG